MEALMDILTHKHERFGFELEREDLWQSLEVEDRGTACRVRVPRIYDNGVERILKVVAGEGLLWLIGEVGHDLYERGRIGCLIVARPLDDGTWVTVVFHSLYPLAGTGLV
jgi:hypothetical protein